MPKKASCCIECVIPILRVANLAASIRHYTDILGFVVDWGGEPASQIASVSRDGYSIMLCEGDQGQPGTWVWIGVEDAAAIFEEYQSAGANIIQPLTNYPWAYEFRVQDPDGHTLRIGSDTRPDLPIV